MTKNKAGAQKPQTQNITQQKTAQASTDAGAVKKADAADEASNTNAREKEASKPKAADDAKSKKKEAAKPKATDAAKSNVMEKSPLILAQEKAKELRDAARKKLQKEEKAKSEKAEQGKGDEEKSGNKISKDNRPVFKDDRGLQYRFKKTAPKSLNIDGKSTKVSDIIKDNEVMLELIYGNSNFIEQIY